MLFGCEYEKEKIRQRLDKISADNYIYNITLEDILSTLH